MAKVMKRRPAAAAPAKAKAAKPSTNGKVASKQNISRIKGGGILGDLKSLKADMERGGGAGGNESFLKRVPEDDGITVRFLTDPEQWYAYFEHYDEIRRFYPCTDDCPGCLEGDNPSKKYLATALDVEEGRVIPLVLAKTLASRLLKRYEKHSTLMDRDYELTRTGSGFDTQYFETPEAPRKLSLKQYDDKLLDLGEVLENQLNRAFAEDDEEEDTRPAKKTGRAASTKKAPAKKPAAPVVEEDDEEEDEAEGYDREALESMNLKDLRSYAKEQGYTPAALRGLDQDAIIELVLGDGEEDEDEEEEYEESGLDEFVPNKEDDEEDEEEDEEEEEEDDEEDDSEEGEEEEEEEYLDEDELRAMPVQKLRTFAKDYGVKYGRGATKEELIDKILEAAEGDDEDDDPGF